MSWLNRLRRIAQQAQNAISNNNSPQQEQKYLTDDICYDRLRNGSHNTNGCFLTTDNNIKANGVIFDENNKNVMKRVLGYKDAPIQNQHECLLEAKLGGHCKGENIYNTEETGCPMYMFKEVDMVGGKTVENYIKKKIDSIEVEINNINKNEKISDMLKVQENIEKLICEIGKGNLEANNKKLEKLFYPILEKMLKMLKIPSTHIEDTINNFFKTTYEKCKPEQIKQIERSSQCFVANDKIYKSMMNNILNPELNLEENENKDINLTNFPDAKIIHSKILEAGDNLRNVSSNLLDNEKYKNDNINLISKTSVNMIIGSTLKGGDFKEDIQKYSKELQEQAIEQNKILKKKVKKYGNIVNTIKKKENEMKQTIENFENFENFENRKNNKILNYRLSGQDNTGVSESNLLKRRISLNVESSKLKDIIISVMYYITILCVLFVVFVLASSFSTGKSVRGMGDLKENVNNTFNNINSEIANLLKNY